MASIDVLLLHISFIKFQYFNLHFGSLLHCFIKLSFAIVYSFSKDFCPCPFVIHLQRATVHPCIKLFNMCTKDCGPCLPVYLQRVLMVRTLKDLVYFQFVSTIFASPAFGVTKIFVI